jgi:hypothetical protein
MQQQAETLESLLLASIEDFVRMSKNEKHPVQKYGAIFQSTEYNVGAHVRAGSCQSVRGPLLRGLVYIKLLSYGVPRPVYTVYLYLVY